MAWQPTVFMERERDGNIEQVRFNRHEIMQHKADGWREISGNDHAVKVVPVEETISGENIIPVVVPEVTSPSAADLVAKANGAN